MELVNCGWMKIKVITVAEFFLFYFVKRKSNRIYVPFIQVGINQFSQTDCTNNPNSLHTDGADGCVTKSSFCGWEGWLVGMQMDRFKFNELNCGRLLRFIYLYLLEMVFSKCKWIGRIFGIRVPLHIAGATARGKAQSLVFIWAYTYIFIKFFMPNTNKIRPFCYICTTNKHSNDTLSAFVWQLIDITLTELSESISD